jgi:voltage-gated potassium channel
MDSIVFLIFRRMRRPLITLVVVYSISVLGLTLIPGRDGDGNVWHMGFFHAFYFVSFMSTTIGFGEIPYAFTDAQRMWVILSVYVSVISWLYAAGNILTLLQDKTFQEALRERRFASRVKEFKESFYLICGYGETGRELTMSLTDRGKHAVVIDIDEHQINLIKLQNLRDYVPSLHADARIPKHLLEAGLNLENCAAVVALTDDNESNLKIAITAKLLHPDIEVICRADSHDVEANMASFGTDYIIDPFDTFARYLSIALQMPGLYLLHRWFTERETSDWIAMLEDEGGELPEPVYPPAHGHWIICGYGRFGKALYERLSKEDMSITVIEATPELTGQPKEGVIHGRGTEADTLQQAGIVNAAGIVAGTDNDANNLSIVMTANELNSDLFVIARQNRRQNDALYEEVGADMVMRAGAIIADRIRVLLTTPMLYQFMSLSILEDDAWACDLMSRTIGLVSNSNTVPLVQEIRLQKKTYGGVCEAIEQGELVRLSDIMRDVSDRSRHLDCIALMLQRRGATELMPPAETDLQIDDKLLFTGSPRAFRYISWTLRNRDTLDYVITGKEKSNGWLWKKLTGNGRKS